MKGHGQTGPAGAPALDPVILAEDNAQSSLVATDLALALQLKLETVMVSTTVHVYYDTGKLQCCLQLKERGEVGVNGVEGVNVVMAQEPDPEVTVVGISRATVLHQRAKVIVVR